MRPTRANFDHQSLLQDVNNRLKSFLLRPQKTLDLKGQDGGDEHQNFIAKITE